ncbi:MAG: di-trans,poly-cis-decaprenylcistransferase [Oligoflexia bacterium]|nr:di-trans,poly-cis-decaprenylcistransferase [Oligoflexia bacterium]MBF0364403.1 di-trans,poly-cis-decaprenylcistransferase [Oligoflexia bacterium]
MPAKIEHVAIIMDGNGRWARARNRPRIWGHVRGSSRVSEIVEVAANLEGVRSLTLYAFSTENWGRPIAEVSALFLLLQKYIQKEKNRIISNRICFKVIGEISRLPKRVQQLILELESATKDFKNPRLYLNFAFDYGGRSEITAAVNRFMQQNPGKAITEDDIGTNLDTFRYSATQNIDLLIRTGGDQRISNFLLWQAAYAELYFLEKYWPEFSGSDFIKIYREVILRERRFGGVSSSSEILEVSQAHAKSAKKLREQELLEEERKQRGLMPGSTVGHKITS